MRVVSLRGHEHTIREMAFSPDGCWVASSSDDATVRLWNLRAADPSASVRALGTHTDLLIFSPDSHRLVTADREGGRLHVWDWEAAGPAAQLIVLPGPARTLREIVISPDNRWIVTRHADKTTRLWDLKKIQRR